MFKDYLKFIFNESKQTEAVARKRLLDIGWKNESRT